MARYRVIIAVTKLREICLQMMLTYQSYQRMESGKNLTMRSLKGAALRLGLR